MLWINSVVGILYDKTATDFTSLHRHKYLKCEISHIFQLWNFVQIKIDRFYIFKTHAIINSTINKTNPNDLTYWRPIHLPHSGETEDRIQLQLQKLKNSQIRNIVNFQI
jgi:predicted nucleic acid binding AN1-type Zn finger protein